MNKLRIGLCMVMLALGYHAMADGHENNIFLKVHYKQAKPGDTIILELVNPVKYWDTIRAIAATGKEGVFSFQVPVADSCGYLRLKKNSALPDRGGRLKNRANMTQPMFWTRGDSIDLHISYKETYTGVYNQCYFTGRGGLKYTLAQQVDSIFNQPDPEEDFSSCAHLFERPHKKARSQALEIIKAKKDKLEFTTYCVLLANVYFRSAGYTFLKIGNCYGRLSTSEEKKAFLKNYFEHKEELLSTPLPVRALVHSNFVPFKFAMYRRESAMVQGKEDFNWIYDSIREKETGDIRDRLIALLVAQVRKPDNFSEILEQSDAIVQEKYSRILLDDFKAQASGRELKDFVLWDASDRQVKLSDFRGKIILLDFWSNGCGGCHKFYVEALRKVKQHYKADASVAFISVGIDRKKDRWLKGIESGMYTSKDAINLTTGKLGSDHPALTKNQINATPTAILLDKAGKIIKFNTDDLYHEQSLSQAIAELK